MPQYPIPNDWNGTDWECVIIEWPYSEQWFGMLRGLITSALRGRFWDGSTGSITDAQEIGREIEERNPVTTCEDIVTALNAINTTIANLDTGQDIQTTVLVDIDNNIQAIANSTASLVSATSSVASANSRSYAWSRSLSTSFASLKVLNNVSLQIRAIEPGVDPPPTVEEEAETGITSATQNMSNAEICKRAYWLWKTTEAFWVAYLKSVANVSLNVLSGVALISDALEAASNLVPGGTPFYLVPASALQTVAQVVDVIGEQVSPDICLQQIVDWLQVYSTDIVCILYEKTQSGESTEAIFDAIYNSAETDGGISGICLGLLLATFNLNTFSSMYFISSLMPSFPAPPPPWDNCELTCFPE